MKKGYIYIFLTTILFSSMEIALKMIAPAFNPIQLTFLRFLIGSLILFPFAIRELKNKNICFKANDFGFFALTGFICVVISMILYQLALLYSPASTVAILLSSISVFSVLFAAIFLGEKIYFYTVISIFINIIGITVIINPWQMSGDMKGIVLILLSSAAFAAYSVMSRNRIPYYGGTTLTSLSFLLGSVEILLLMWLTHADFIANYFLQSGMNFFANVPVIQGITLATLPNLIFAGVFATGFGYMFYFLGMEATSTATGSLVFFIKPALAPVFAWIILHETITMNVIAGITLIIVGSTISFVGEQRKRNPQSAGVIN